MQIYISGGGGGAASIWTENARFRLFNERWIVRTRSKNISKITTTYFSTKDRNTTIQKMVSLSLSFSRSVSRAYPASSLRLQLA